MYNHKPTNTDREEVEDAIGEDKIKTLTLEELVETEKQITINEIEFCLKKNIIAHGSSGFTGAFYKVFWSSLKTLVFKTINAISY